MTEPVKTRDRILARGVDLLSARGLAGVTVGVLAEDTGMSKSGLFAHFRSKEEMQLAMLRRSIELVEVHVVAPAMRLAAGLPRLTEFVKGWLGWTSRIGLSGGCPLAAAIFEVDDLEGDVRDYVVDAEARTRTFLTELVCGAVDAGDLRADLDVEQFVWELRGIYLSHHVSSRLSQDPRASAQAIRAYDALVAAAGRSTASHG